jgi:hypothetical protein
VAQARQDAARDQAELRAGLEAQIAALEEAQAGLQARAEQAEAELQRARTGPGKAAGPARCRMTPATSPTGNGVAARPIAARGAEPRNR